MQREEGKQRNRLEPILEPLTKKLLEGEARNRPVPQDDVTDGGELRALATEHLGALVVHADEQRRLDTLVRAQDVAEGRGGLLSRD